MHKLILLAPFFLFFAACSGSTEADGTETAEIDSNYCDCNDLVFDDGYNHFYRFERREGFTGLCESFFGNKQKQLEKNFVDGKVHGKMITYHDNGQIHIEEEFDMNFQVGEKIIYTKSGQVKFHATYKRGKQLEVLVTKPQLDINS